MNEGQAAAVRELIAMANGQRSDPDHRPDDDPAGTCGFGGDLCDEPATVWRWIEDHGGWTRVCAGHEEAELWT